MGYRPSQMWVGELALLDAANGTKDTERVIRGLSLALRHAIGEIKWEMQKDPVVEESGSFERVLQDLEFALEGADRLKVAASAAFCPLNKPGTRRRR